MKNYIKYFNQDRLQQHINEAIREIENDTENNYISETGEFKEYIAETLVSGYEGQYTCKTFCRMFNLRHNKEWIYDEIYNYFNEMADNLKKHIELKPGYDIYIGFNSNDGSIELFVTKEIEEEVEG